MKGDPHAFRSWLVAIAIRQIRAFYQARALSLPDTAAPAGVPEADFTGLTIMQLGLAGQRRETAEAGRWLDEDDRDLLALWWQEASGRLDRQEVAAALGLPPRHAAVRIARMKEQLATARIVVRALARTAGYLQPKVIASSFALVACATAGTVAAVHGHAATATTISTPRTRPATPVPSPAGPFSARPSAQRVIARPAAAPSRPPVTTSPALPAPATVTSSKKGVGTWAFGGVSQSLTASGASWFYNWSASPAGITVPPGVSFVPMIWGPAAVTSATLGQVRNEGRILLGFNEPDLSSQSSMTVPQALSLWPQLMSTGMTLGSPAVAAGAATPGGWLDQFMRGAAARGYRVSFITVHWYGSDYATGPAVSQLKSYLQAVYDRYHLPIWLTEFALPVSTTDGSTGLFGAGGVATQAGRAFEAAGRP